VQSRTDQRIVQSKRIEEGGLVVSRSRHGIGDDKRQSKCEKLYGWHVTIDEMGEVLAVCEV